MYVRLHYLKVCLVASTEYKNKHKHVFICLEQRYTFRICFHLECFIIIRLQAARTER